MQWGESIDDALKVETELGLEVILSGETREGAARFADGVPPVLLLRHGQYFITSVKAGI